MKRLLWIGAFLTMFFGLAWAADATKMFDAAAQVLQKMASSKQIPSFLLSDAKCIAVIPKLTKAGFIVGGKHGNGVVACRTASGWSAPAFISMSGGSIGLQAGGEEQDIVLLMNSQGKQQLQSGHWDLAAEAVAAGPSGEAGGSASTGWKAPVLSYASSSGAFAGADIGSSKLATDEDANRKLYGEGSSMDSILGGQVQMPVSAQQFEAALRGIGER